MIETEVFSYSYTGNGSTVTGYPVPFPFLGNHSYVKCAVLLDGDAEETILTGGDYTVHQVGAAYEVRTAVAYVEADTVRVYRELPLTQPLDLPISGALSPVNLETALDRLVMQMQQIASLVGGLSIGAGYIVEGNVTFAGAAERAAAVPTRVGQLAVQLEDMSYWVSTGITAGAWTHAIPSFALIFLNETTADADGNIIISTANGEFQTKLPYIPV